MSDWFASLVRPPGQFSTGVMAARQPSNVPMIEFVAAGSPQVVSRAIEEYARSQQTLSAIVVPWESRGSVLSMSVTAVAGDGWAIEHTNLGTIRLTDLGNEQTRV